MTFGSPADAAEGAPAKDDGRLTDPNAGATSRAGSLTVAVTGSPTVAAGEPVEAASNPTRPVTHAAAQAEPEPAPTGPRPTMARATHAYQRTEFVPIGVLASFGSHVDGPATTGIGIEATYVRVAWSRRIFPMGYGAIAQAQMVGGNHARFLLGAQGNIGPAGLELGPAVETAADGYSTTVAAHVAPFVSMGVIAVALRIAPPLSGGRAYSTDVSAVLTVKPPFGL